MADKHIIRGPEPLIPLPTTTIGEVIFESLKENIGKPDALLDAVSNETESYAGLLEKSIKVAIALKNFGVGPQDIVALSSENNIPYFYPTIGSLFVGATVAPLNISYVKDELQHAVGILEPKIIFCSPLTVQGFLNLRGEFKCVKKIVVIDSDEEIPGTESLGSFIKNNVPANLKEFKPTHVDLEETVAILFSSGTTGLPKGVMLSHVNFHTLFRVNSDPRFLPALDENEVLLGQLPFYHGYGLYVSLMAICCQTKYVIIKKFDFLLFLQSIQDHKITRIYIVPPIALALAKHPIIDNFDLSSIKYINCGAASLRKEVQLLVEKRLKVPVRQGYGMTELAIVSTLTPPTEQRPGSVGKVFPGMEVKVRDPETGRSLGPNQVGEMCFRGNMIMKGYYKNEEATKACFDVDGFFRTGDLAYYDEEGYFYIVDRLKELIKYKGFQVPPAELEAILTKHPKIVDAGVIGVPDEAAGELPLAFVVVAEGASLTEKEVEDFVAGQVSHPKRLRGGVIFVKQIPKSPSGKILRKDLKSLLKALNSKL